jgi:methylphosphotriester-DNA--protein-cysteine methyltransferase
MSADGVSIVTEPATALDGRTIDTLIVAGACSVDDVRRDRELIALEETDDRIEDIARGCGFSNEEQLRGVFARHVAISPRAYRDRFALA